MSLMLASVIALAQGGSAQAAAPTLVVGSPAPKLVVEKWVRGNEVKEFEKGKVYVVEFWATWCGPCITSMPHLSALSEKYKGKAQFIGVNVWDRGDDERTANNPQQMKRVTDFMKKYEKEMRYDVVVDTPDDYMSMNWLRAAGQNGIPSSFIVQNGQVAWIGHPMEMDKPLEEVVAGTWTIEKAKADEAEKAEKMRKYMAEQQAWVKKLSNAGAAHDMDAFVDIASKGPNGAKAPLFMAIQAVVPTQPTFALRVMEEKGAGIEPTYISSMCVYVVAQKNATDADKAKAVQLATAAAERAEYSMKAETYTGLARVYIGLKKNAEAREAIKKARMHIDDVKPEHKNGLTDYINSVEKSIKD